MQIHSDIAQGTPEWDTLRCGRFTASVDFQQLVTGRTETYKKLIRKKAAERISGQLVQSEYSNANMARGNALEAEAREAFELETGRAVSQVGFCELNEWVGASPDGLVGEDAGIEIKCKDVHTHLDCFIDGRDKSYDWQIQGNLWVTGRKQWYFVSYNPHYAHLGKHLFIDVVQRDEDKIAQIAAGVEKGIADVKKLLEVFK
jgi:hypothetical protein